MIQETAKVLLG